MDTVVAVGIPIAIAVFAALVIGALVWGAIRDPLARFRESHIRNRNTRQVNDLYRASVDKRGIQRALKRGTSIDTQDGQGNTALHLAYYEGRRDAVANLIEFGADENLRNRELLTPVEMADVASVEGLVRRGMQCMSIVGAWLDRIQAKIVYRELKEREPRIFNPALVRVILNCNERRTVVYLAVKLGIHGSEEKLGEILDGYGDKEMAEDYLNAGSSALRLAAEQWAERNGYRIYQRGGRHVVTWGQF